jgi:hypothetical protein
MHLQYSNARSKSGCNNPTSTHTLMRMQKFSFVPFLATQSSKQITGKLQIKHYLAAACPAAFHLHSVQAAGKSQGIDT